MTTAVLLQAFWLVFDPYVLLVILCSAMFGLFVGCIPGLSATMATALLVPITFFMPPVPAIAAIVIAAIANERPTPAGFRELVDFPISGELREQLHERIAEVAAKLSAAELFAAAAEAGFKPMRRSLNKAPFYFSRLIAFEKA